MSKYTVSVAKLIDNGFDFGLNDYPIFDEQYRQTLNNAILDYFYMYEIGFETPYLFRHYLRTKLNLIMPKYNAMYVAQTQIISNPLGNINLTEQNNRSINTQGTTTATNTGSSKSLFQDTPQGKITQGGIDAQNWATSVTMDSNNGSGTSNVTGNTVEGYTKTLIGSNGHKYSVEIYNKLINSFQSVNQMVIDDLQDLFMGVL